MRITVPVAECYKCEEYIYDQADAYPLVDGYDRMYGYHCVDCAEGAFDSYMESRIA
jgi:hypothetical protein